MNYVTYEITEILNIEAEEALKVQDYLEQSFFDFSQCTNREFRKEVKQAHMVINARK